ncbi:MAG: Ig-like domain-containing protein, partial [Clostridiales bacterium]|nr:Ig-like domain-containing protein [Clostridiales bacterium]
WKKSRICIDFSFLFFSAGYTVSGLTITTSADYNGLFGYVGSGGVVKNLTVKGSVTGGYHVAGIVAFATDATIANCINKATVTGANKVGGVVGCLSAAMMYNCQNEGTITGTVRCAGGVAGDVYPSGSISNCCNIGSVTGVSLVGGISGGCTEAEVINCNNSGTVMGSSKVGGICGDNSSYAGTRMYNYFYKTSIINSSFSVSGTNCSTYATKSTTLDASVKVSGTTCTKAVNALNTWVNANSGSVKYKKWKVNSNGKLVLSLTTNSSSTVAVTSLSLSGSSKTTVGKSITLTLGVSPSNASNKTVTWSSSSTSVATVSSSGKVTAKKPGKTTITATATDGSGKKATHTIIVYPAKNKITGLTSSKKSFTVKWSKVSGVTGYQIQYDTSSSFSGDVTTTTISGAKNVSYTAAGLKKGKTYYVRVRSYKTISGKKYYSSWSTKKKIKIVAN